MIFILLTIVARLGTFSFSSIDHDESTYLIIANQWLRGDLPWVQFVDIKPIGIYALFACAIKLFGSTFVSARILATLSIAITALIVTRILRQIGISERIGMAGGFLYIVCMSIHQWSWAANTEIFFNLCTAIGLLTWLKMKDIRDYLLLGVVMGIGFCIKYHVLFDLTAFIFVDLIFVRRSFLKQLKPLLWIGLGFAVPIALWLGTYLVLGHQAVLQEVIWEMPSRYSATSGIGEKLNFIGEFYLVFLPISLLFIRTVWQAYASQGNRTAIYTPRLVGLVLIWPVMVWCAILLTGKLFFHYYMQQILPLVLVGSLSIPHLIQRRQFSKTLKWSLVGILFLLLLASPVHQHLELSHKEDVAKSAAKIITKDLASHDIIFANTDHVVYLLCDRAPPTRYVHSSVFHKEELRIAFGMDLRGELQSIFDQQPRYCLIRGDKDALMQAHLKNYRQLETFRGGVELWGI